MFNQRLKTIPFLSFLGIAAFLIACAILLIDSYVYKLEPSLLATGLTIDLTLTLSVSFYFLVVRPNQLSPLLVIPILGFGIFLSHMIIPEQNHQTVEVIAGLLGAFEIPFLCYIVWKTIKLIKEVRAKGDELHPREAVERVFVGVLPNKTLAIKISKFAYTELAIMWFAFFSWFREVPTADSKTVFSHHKTTQWRWFVIIFIVLGIIEAFALHGIISAWKPWVAWVHAGLCVYSGFWLIGDWQALRHSVFRIRNGKVDIEVGLRGYVQFPLELIEKVERGVPPEPPEKELKKGEFVSAPVIEGYAQMTPIDDVEVSIYLKEEITVGGIFGIDKQAHIIGVAPDDPEAFMKSLASRKGVV